jgi:type I restriction enzyme M protein
MSEDLVYKQARRLGRFGYLPLGSTTLAQLKRSKFVRTKLEVDEEKRKPPAPNFPHEVQSVAAALGGD